VFIASSNHDSGKLTMPSPVVGRVTAPVGHPWHLMDGGVWSRYAFGMVTFCKNCGKVFVLVPDPGILSLRLLRCKCGHSQIVTVWSVLDKPIGRRPFPWLPGHPPSR